MLETLKKYRWHMGLMGLMVFCMHGAKLNSDVIGIDTEDLIHIQGDFYGGWLISGRQGLVFLKYLFLNFTFEPYFAGVATLLLFAAAVASFCLLWDGTGLRDRTGASGGTSALAWGLCGFLWISHPFMAEQFYFSLQSMEICMGFIATALSLWLSYRFEQTRRPLFFAGGFLLLLLTFSMYQIFVVCYIFGAVTLLLLRGFRELFEEDVTAAGLLRRIPPYIAVFLSAFLLNELITRLFFGSSDYLSNQIRWGNAPVGDCLYRIAGHIGRVFFDMGAVFYNAVFGFLALFLAALTILILRRQKSGKAVAAVFLFWVAALLVTPFLMTFLLGAAPAPRSQMVLPVATGFLAYLDVELLVRLTAFAESGAGGERGRSLRRSVLVCVTLVCVFCGLEQAKVTSALYYTDRCRYEQDRALGYSLIERIDAVTKKDGGLPVAILGHQSFQPNNACVEGHIIGQSFFDYDTEVEPAFWWSTRRMLGFLHVLGRDYDQVAMELMWKAEEYGRDMPVWPLEGSVRRTEDMIVVKLSD